MHCDANAYCLLIPETSDFKCECKPGYNGTGTECTDVCMGYCDNEGVCLKDSRGQPSCRCSGSFTGKRCTEKSEFFYITGGIAGGVILIIFVVLLVWMICVRLVGHRKFLLPSNLFLESKITTRREWIKIYAFPSILKIIISFYFKNYYIVLYK